MKRIKDMFTTMQIFAVGGALLLGGCATSGGEGEAKGKDKADAGADKAAEGEAKDAADDKVAGKPVDGAGTPATKPGAGDSDKPYELKIASGDAAVGEDGSVSITVVPASDWHLNMEFPTKLKVAPPDGVTLTKAEMGIKDAKKFEEAGCEFNVDFKAADAGKKEFTGEFKFAVCQGESACSMKTEQLAFSVDVK